MIRIKLKNTSFRPTDELQYLVDFVSAHFSLKTKVILYVADQLRHSRITGLALENQIFSRNGSRTQNQITIKLGDRKFPYATQYLPEVPPQTIETWQEEFVLVLGHELGHVRQFLDQIEISEYEAEVDAERQGYRALAYWKKFKKELTNFLSSPIVAVKESHNGRHMEDRSRRKRPGTASAYPRKRTHGQGF